MPDVADLLPELLELVAEGERFLKTEDQMLGLPLLVGRVGVRLLERLRDALQDLHGVLDSRRVEGLRQLLERVLREGAEDTASVGSTARL